MVHVLLTTDVWFSDPFSFPQMISWILLAASLVLAIGGFWLLFAGGKPAGWIETTTLLVRRGLYRYIRHPLYSSLLFGSWGIFFKTILPSSLAIACAISFFIVMTARAEEKENLQKFGTAYRDYMKGTKRFIPFLV